MLQKFISTAIMLSLLVIPVWAHGGHDDEFKGIATPSADTVHVTPAVQQAIGLKVAPVQIRSLQPGLGTTGRIEALPSLSIEVNAPLSGRLLQVPARQGQTVRTGETLATLDSPEIRQLTVDSAQQKSQIQADLLRLTAQVNLAKATYEREKQLYQADISAQKDLQQAQAALISAQADLRAAQSRLTLVAASLKARLAQLGSLNHGGVITLKAPQSGYIASQTIASGEAVEPGRLLFQIVNTRQVWATADIYEKDLAQIRLGQTVEVRVNALPTQVFSGKVSVIDAVVNADTRTLKVRALLNNAQGLLKPGMFANLTLVKGASVPVTIIPQSAVLDIDQQQVVYVKNGDDFIATPVQLGERFGAAVAVTDGLFEGDQVVTQRAFQLRAQGLRGDISAAEPDGEIEKKPLKSTEVSPWPWLAGALALAGAFVGGMWVARQQMINPSLRQDSFAKKES